MPTFLKLISLNKRPKTVVQIAGGLGTQILGYSTFKTLQKDNPQCFLDTTYFNLSLDRPFALDPFGISLDSLPTNPNLKRCITQRHNATSKIKRLAYRVMKKILMLNMSYHKDNSPTRLKLALEFLISNEAQSTFKLPNPIKKEAEQLLQSKKLSVNQFIPIHVRQGDYLHSPDHIIVGIDFAISLLNKGLISSHQPLLWISDSPLIEEDIHRALPKWKSHFYINGDAHTSHALIRLGSTAITSNSTFSLTAALLSQKPFYSPNKWFSEVNDYLHKALLDACRALVFIA